MARGLELYSTSSWLVSVLAMGLATSWIALPPPSWGEETVLYTSPMGGMMMTYSVLLSSPIPGLLRLLAWPDIATHSGDPRNPAVSVSSAPAIGAGNRRVARTGGGQG